MDDPQNHLRESSPSGYEGSVSLSELSLQALGQLGRTLVLANEETGALPGVER